MEFQMIEGTVEGVVGPVLADLRDFNNGYAVLGLIGNQTDRTWTRSTVWGSTPFTEAAYAIYVLHKDVDGSYVPYNAIDGVQNQGFRPHTSGGIFLHQSRADFETACRTVQKFPGQPYANVPDPEADLKTEIRLSRLVKGLQENTIVEKGPRKSYGWDEPPLPYAVHRPPTLTYELYEPSIV
jgi:hypothetical protein